MNLASLDDINQFLPTDKLSLASGEDTQFQVEVARIIKAELGNTFDPVTLAEWIDEDSTPAYIRSVAGRLIAAFYYRERFSEDNPGVPEYAQLLYNEAMAMLGKVVTGAVILEEISIPREADLRSWPDETVPAKFGMDLVL